MGTGLDGNLEEITQGTCGLMCFHLLISFNLMLHC